MKYSIKKYNGDDSYSYAVFRAEDVKGMRSPIFYGDTLPPLINGLGRTEALYYKKKLEAEGK